MSIESDICATLKGKNIVLVGFMMVGKTTIGRILASRFNIPFVDTDYEIEKLSSMKIRDFFRCYGENSFRDLESQVLQLCLQRSNSVISTGGGAYINEKSREVIHMKGITLCLQANYDILWNRIQNSTNCHLLDVENPEKVFRKLMKERNPIYMQADMVLNSSDLSIEETVEHVMKKIADFGNY